jgi:hypothetical protein
MFIDLIASSGKEFSSLFDGPKDLSQTSPFPAQECPCR